MLITEQLSKLKSILFWLLILLPAPPLLLLVLAILFLRFIYRSVFSIDRDELSLRDQTSYDDERDQRTQSSDHTTKWASDEDRLQTLISSGKISDYYDDQVAEKLRGIRNSCEAREAWDKALQAQDYLVTFYSGQNDTDAMGHEASRGMHIARKAGNQEKESGYRKLSDEANDRTDKKIMGQLIFISGFILSSLIWLIATFVLLLS